MNGPMFLTDEEVSRLTGRKLKGAQISTLRLMGIPFFVNATGRAVVTRAAVEGGNHPVAQKPAHSWSPKVLKAV